jgi:hypothetical protein
MRSIGDSTERFKAFVKHSFSVTRPLRSKSSVLFYGTRAAAALVANEIIGRPLRGCTRCGEAVIGAVLIHKHRARLSPRLIPGFLPSQCVALFRTPTRPAGRDAVRNAVARAKYRCRSPSHRALSVFNESGNVAETHEGMIGRSVMIGFLA